MGHSQKPDEYANSIRLSILLYLPPSQALQLWLVSSAKLHNQRHLPVDLTPKKPNLMRPHHTLRTLNNHPYITVTINANSQVSFNEALDHTSASQWVVLELDFAIDNEGIRLHENFPWLCGA